jgi:hypothetical protein
MEYRFDADEWATLAKEQRMQRCVWFGNEARTLAEAAPPKLKEGYLALAAQWLALADEITKTGV